MSLLFVYGTLKRGHANERQMEGARCLGPARTAPGFALVGLGAYPGLVADPAGGDGVLGEVWEVTPAHLARLDVFEDVPGGEYRRAPVPLAEHPPGTPPRAETYLYARDAAGLPRLGDTWTRT